MSQAFSRWPSPASQASRAAGPSADGLPDWMNAAPGSPLSHASLGVVAPFVLVFVPAVTTVILAWSGFDGPGLASALMAAVALTCAGLAAIHVARLQAAVGAAERRFAAAFDRAGVAMWLEDWTAAGDAVATLRRAGISDIEGYFADRPDELRAICGKVVIKDVNAVTLEETGAPDKTACLVPLDRLLPSTDQTFVQWLVAFGRGDATFRSEAHIVRADGSEMDTLFAARLPSDRAGFADIVVTSLDVTSYKQAQARLAEGETEIARASRLASVGALSASIAHEVNTPLAAISANAQAALRWLNRDVPEVAEAAAALGDVVTQARRARDVVARTRSLLAKAPMDMKPIDLAEAAREASLFAERDVRASGATILLTAAPDLPPVRGDLVQLQQVFVNLFVNAAQAMADRPGRRDITVTVRPRDDMVHVVVSDTGPGIAPALRGHVFDPLQSTKPGGMGIGLAICSNCIDGHGGRIWVEDAPTGGAAFHILLPIARPAP